MTFAPELVLHDVTRQLCAAFIRDHDHGLLLHGGDGCGLRTLATVLAQALNTEHDGTSFIEPLDDKDITIEQIRQLYHDTRAVRNHQLSVIINDAERMSVPAQNAFLKLLEEPPARVVFILTSHSPQLLLETIRSRVSSIEVRPISAEASRQLITSAGVTDATTISQLLFLARGKPAGLLKLIALPDYFAHRAETMRVARSIVQSSTYQRLILLREAMGERERALEIVQTIGDVIQFGMKKAPTAHTADQLGVISRTIDHLKANANVRVQLLLLALAL